MKPTIYATAPSPEGIRKCISEFYGGATISLVPTNTERTWAISNLNGHIPGMEVVVSKGRYIFRACVEVVG